MWKLQPLPIIGISACQTLAENVGLYKDQKVIIHGGAGEIGSIAIKDRKVPRCIYSNNSKHK